MHFIFAQTWRKFHGLGENDVWRCAPSLWTLHMMSRVCDNNIPLSLLVLSLDRSVSRSFNQVEGRTVFGAMALEPISLKPFIRCMDLRTDSFFILALLLSL